MVRSVEPKEKTIQNESSTHINNSLNTLKMEQIYHVCFDPVEKNQKTT